MATQNISKEQLEQGILNVEYLALASKITRLMHHPLRYIYAIGLKSLGSQLIKKDIEKQVALFTGHQMKIYLPSAADIYLTGGKSHPSEIRLAKYLIKNINEGDLVWDLGAHYGYFTLIASALVGESGKVITVEASPKTYEILESNCVKLNNVTLLHFALSYNNEPITFYEFPNRYSEYNTSEIAQFEQEDWFQKVNIITHKMNTITMDELWSNHSLEKAPTFIKMDVEGGELAAIQGGEVVLQKYSPKIIMEYLAPERDNKAHMKAVGLLRSWGYQSYRIRSSGNIKAIVDLNAYLAKENLDSDNILFIKSTKT